MTTPKETNRPLIFDGVKYPTYQIMLGDKKFISTSPYINNGDTVITAKKNLAPTSEYEVIVATPEGRTVQDLWGNVLGTPDNNVWKELLRQFNIKPAKKQIGGYMNYLNLF